MTDVNALNGYTQTGTTNNTASQNLSADMNTFLTLLTTQLNGRIYQSAGSVFQR